MRKLTGDEISIFNRALSNRKFLKNGYWHVGALGKRFKVSRLKVMLHIGTYLEKWELVHHKDGDRKNDNIENLEVLNFNKHSSKHHSELGKKPKGWKPVNTTKQKTINRILKISSEMIKVNCSEISRRLEKEGIKISSATVKKYIAK